MIKKSTFTIAFTCVALAVALSSCGGGSGSSATVSGPVSDTSPDLPALTPTIPLVVGSGSAIVASIPTANYLAGSEELAAFNLLNAERSRCGFGLLAQNAALDKAALAHADYQNLNNVVGHMENVGYLGFTGISPGDRMSAAGYSNPTVGEDELVAFNGKTIKTGVGADSVRSLLNAPYHMRGVLGASLDVGIAVRSTEDVGNGFNAVVAQLDMAYTVAAGKQLISSTDVNTYPCAGTTGSNYKLTNESPNPVSGRDLVANPLGSTVYISLRYGNTLTITSASMKQVSNNAIVALRTPVTSANSGNAFLSHEGYVVADNPMLLNTAYLVTIDGTNNGVVFNKTFTFTTGSGG